MHTPLLRSLVQAVRKGQQELQQIGETNTHESSTISRRELFKKGAFVATAAMVPNFITNTLDTANASTKKRIAILGGGIAGLTTAFRLNQKGIHVTLYEGNSRLGGRCWSGGKGWNTGFTKDAHYELGGELIDTGHTELRHLIGELNTHYPQYLHNKTKIKLDNMYAAELDGAGELYYFENEPYDYNTSIKDLKAILPFVQDDYDKSGYPVTYYQHTEKAKILDKMNLKEYLYGAPTKPYHSHTLAARAKKKLTPKVQKLLEIAYVTEYGAEIKDQSSLGFINMFGTATLKNPWIFGESDETYLVRGGNETIARTLTNAVTHMGTKVHLKHIVRDINKNHDDQYVISFENGVQATYDIIICTIPFRILRDILSEAKMKHLGFKPRKIDAILHYPIGYNTKHYIQFNSRYWNTKKCSGATMSDLSPQMSWETTRAQITNGTTIHNGAGILTLLTGGTQSYKGAKQPLSITTKNALNDLEKIMPGIRKEYSNKTTIMPWPLWKFSKGAYSYYAPGNFTRFSGVEIEKEGNMYFCGEHTSINYQGYFNGAIETAEITAKQLIKDLKKKAATI